MVAVQVLEQGSQLQEKNRAGVSTVDETDSSLIGRRCDKNTIDPEDRQEEPSQREQSKRNRASSNETSHVLNNSPSPERQSSLDSVPEDHPTPINTEGSEDTGSVEKGKPISATRSPLLSTEPAPTSPSKLSLPSIPPHERNQSNDSVGNVIPPAEQETVRQPHVLMSASAAAPVASRGQRSDDLQHEIAEEKVPNKEDDGSKERDSEVKSHGLVDTLCWKESLSASPVSPFSNSRENTQRALKPSITQAQISNGSEQSTQDSLLRKGRDDGQSKDVQSDTPDNSSPALPPAPDTVDGSDYCEVLASTSESSDETGGTIAVGGQQDINAQVQASKPLSHGIYPAGSETSPTTKSVSERKLNRNAQHSQNGEMALPVPPARVLDTRLMHIGLGKKISFSNAWSSAQRSEDSTAALDETHTQSLAEKDTGKVKGKEQSHPRSDNVKAPGEVPPRSTSKGQQSKQQSRNSGEKQKVPHGSPTGAALTHTTGKSNAGHVVESTITSEASSLTVIAKGAKVPVPDPGPSAVIENVTAADGETNGIARSVPILHKAPSSTRSTSLILSPLTETYTDSAQQILSEDPESQSGEDQHKSRTCDEPEERNAKAKEETFLQAQTMRGALQSRDLSRHRSKTVNLLDTRIESLGLKEDDRCRVKEENLTVKTESGVAPLITAGFRRQVTPGSSLVRPKSSLPMKRDSLEGGTQTVLKKRCLEPPCRDKDPESTRQTRESRADLSHILCPFEVRPEDASGHEQDDRGLDICSRIKAIAKPLECSQRSEIEVTTLRERKSSSTHSAGLNKSACPRFDADRIAKCAASTDLTTSQVQSDGGRANSFVKQEQSQSRVDPVRSDKASNSLSEIESTPLPSVSPRNEHPVVQPIPYSSGLPLPSTVRVLRQLTSEVFPGMGGIALASPMSMPWTGILPSPSVTVSAPPNEARPAPSLSLNGPNLLVPNLQGRAPYGTPLRELAPSLSTSVPSFRFLSPPRMPNSVISSSPVPVQVVPMPPVSVSASALPSPGISTVKLSIPPVVPCHSQSAVPASRIQEKLVQSAEPTVLPHTPASYIRVSTEQAQVTTSLGERDSAIPSQVPNPMIPAQTSGTASSLRQNAIATLQPPLRQNTPCLPRVTGTSSPLTNNRNTNASIAFRQHSHLFSRVVTPSSRTEQQSSALALATQSTTPSPAPQRNDSSQEQARGTACLPGSHMNANRTALLLRKCLKCGTCASRRWRTGPDGFQTLCNTCGLQYIHQNMIVYEDATTGRISIVEFAGSRKARVVGFHTRGFFADLSLQISGSRTPYRRPPRDFARPVVVPLGSDREVCHENTNSVPLPAQATRLPQSGPVQNLTYIPPISSGDGARHEITDEVCPDCDNTNEPSTTLRTDELDNHLGDGRSPAPNQLPESDLDHREDNVRGGTQPSTPFSRFVRRRRGNATASCTPTSSDAPSIQLAVIDANEASDGIDSEALDVDAMETDETTEGPIDVDADDGNTTTEVERDSDAYLREQDTSEGPMPELGGDLSCNDEEPAGNSRNDAYTAEDTSEMSPRSKSQSPSSRIGIVQARSNLAPDRNICPHCQVQGRVLPEKQTDTVICHCYGRTPPHSSSPRRRREHKRSAPCMCAQGHRLSVRPCSDHFEIPQCHPSLDQGPGREPHTGSTNCSPRSVVFPRRSPRSTSSTEILENQRSRCSGAYSACNSVGQKRQRTGVPFNLEPARVRLQLSESSISEMDVDDEPEKGSHPSVLCPNRRHELETQMQLPRLEKKSNRSDDAGMERQMHSVKAQYRAGFHRLSIPQGMRFLDFKDKLLDAFQLAADVAFQYKDNEDDPIAITSDSDMKELFAVVRQHSLSPIRVIVCDKL